MEAIIQSLYTTVGLLWKALWALGIGYAFSSIIQVFISKKSAAAYLGKGTPKELLIAAMLGFVSSSCSFAALSATRSLYTKGASLISAPAYMFASTNLAVEVALWEDVLTVNGNEVYYTYQVYNEAIVVPESIDAIRALMGTIKDGSESIHITDEAMGIRKEFLIK